MYAHTIGFVFLRTYGTTIDVLSLTAWFVLGGLDQDTGLDR